MTVRPTETLLTAAEPMGHNGVKKLPVVEAGTAVGIVTTTGLALALPNFQVTMAHQQRPTSTTVRGSGPNGVGLFEIRPAAQTRQAAPQPSDGHRGCRG